MTEAERRGYPDSAGFTLIEIIVVLAILSVATALVLPSIGRGSETLQMRSQAGRIAALLREARLLAVTHRRATRVILDRTRNTVTLNSRDADRPVRELAVTAGLRVSVVTGGDSLTFSPRGITRETRWLVEGTGGRRVAIDVEPITGQVTVGREGQEGRS